MKNQKGFTLIEILIVVAIIAILASVVLVGLGPTQSLGRDARRVSDIHEVQNGLELYYNSKGFYPVAASTAWSNLVTALQGANVGVSSVPNDPNSTKTYNYGSGGSGMYYVLQAGLENPTGGPWSGYTAPSAAVITSSTSDGYFGTAKPTCVNPNYCVTL